jgi:hypothetical protein
MKHLKKFNESRYVEMSKRLGHSSKYVSIPTMSEVEELGRKASEGDYDSYYKLFAINRFAIPENDDEIERSNKAVEYFRKYEPIFRD